jgi:hypothetical protein
MELLIFEHSGTKSLSKKMHISDNFSLVMSWFLCNVTFNRIEQNKSSILNSNRFWFRMVLEILMAELFASVSTGLWQTTITETHNKQ